MNITKNLQDYIEQSIDMLEDKNQHEELFREVLNKEGPYFTEEEIIQFFDLIEALDEPQLNESVKKYVLDIVVEIFNEFYTGRVTENEVDTGLVMYVYTPRLTKDILVKHLSICGVKSVKEFLSYLEDAFPQLQIVLMKDSDVDTDESWSVTPEIFIYSELDPISIDSYTETDLTEVAAKDLAYQYSNIAQQIFENIVESEYNSEHKDLPDLDRFI